MQSLSSRSSLRGAALRVRPDAPRPAVAPPCLLVEAAHKKGAGSVKNGQDSEAQRLGVKIYGDQPAFNGNIILRQRGTVWRPGPGTMMGKDHTIFAVIDGMVNFQKTTVRRKISVVPFAVVEAAEGAAAAAAGPAVETRRTRRLAKYEPRGAAAERALLAMQEAAGLGQPSSVAR